MASRQLDARAMRMQPARWRSCWQGWEPWGNSPNQNLVRANCRKLVHAWLAVGFSEHSILNGPSSTARACGLFWGGRVAAACTQTTGRKISTLLTPFLRAATSRAWREWRRLRPSFLVLRSTEVVTVEHRNLDPR